MISGTEMAQKWPATAARLVLSCEREGSDVQSAWSVLVSAVGTARAEELVAAERAKSAPVEWFIERDSRPGWPRAVTSEHLAADKDHAVVGDEDCATCGLATLDGIRHGSDLDPDGSIPDQS